VKPVTRFRVPGPPLENSTSHVLRDGLVDVVADELRHEANPVDLAVHTHRVLTPTSGERVSGGLRNLADHDLGELVLLDDLALAHALSGSALRQGTMILDDRALSRGLGDGGSRVAAMKLAAHLAAAHPRAVALELAVRVDVGDDGGHAILERDADLIRLRVGEVQEVCGVSVSGGLGFVKRSRGRAARVCAEEGAVGVRADDDAVVL